MFSAVVILEVVTTRSFCRGLSDAAAYVHICGNETMSGMAFHTEPEVGPNRVLVADMTSSLLSRSVDVSKYGVIYASSGKNLGPAGNCIVIVREDLLGNELPQVSGALVGLLCWDASCKWFVGTMSACCPSMKCSAISLTTFVEEQSQLHAMHQTAGCLPFACTCRKQLAKMQAHWLCLPHSCYMMCFF